MFIIRKNIQINQIDITQMLDTNIWLNMIRCNAKIMGILFVVYLLIKGRKSRIGKSRKQNTEF